MRRLKTFTMERDVDVTGYSGIGIVADGVVFPDGTCVIRWRGPIASTVGWADVADAIAVNGHDGATRFVFDDAE